MTNDPSQPAPSRWLLPVLGGVILLALAGVVVLAVTRDHRESSEAERRVGEASRGPRVLVAPVEASPGERTVTLPGEVRAFNQATLYAKTAGYLKAIRVDKGDRVKANQVLGVVESPETDQQVSAAQADLLVKRRFAERAKALSPSGVVSQQDLERATSDLEVAQANLSRARALQAYEVLRAPFDGVVTARYADPGALLQAAVPLVEVSDVDRVRVTVYVGQDVAAFLKLGDAVTINQDERPGAPIPGQVTRMATALDPKTRTMLTEVWLDNREYHLYPGTFVHVALRVRVPPLPTAPAEAIFMRGDQLFTAVLQGNKVALVPVETGLSDGKTVQLRQGPRTGELVVLNFPSDLGDGAQVQPVPRKAQGGQTAAAPAVPSAEQPPARKD